MTTPPRSPIGIAIPTLLLLSLGPGSSSAQDPPVEAVVTVTTLTEPFEASGGVTVGPEGDVFVADFGPELNQGNGPDVYRVSPEDGSLELYATGLIGASGNDFNAAGELLQSNIGANRTSRILPDGTVTTFSTGHANPVGLVVDAEDVAYVANCGNRTISRVTPDGVTTQFATSPLLQCPNGITRDDAGNLYVANFNNGFVLHIDPAGLVNLFAVIPGNQNGHLTFANGRLYVVARRANQIYTVEMDGTVSLLAGSGIRGKADGPALQASFSIPNGIAPSPDGRRLYVNDAVSLIGTALNPVVIRVIDLGLPPVEDPPEGAEPVAPR